MKIIINGKSVKEIDTITEEQINKIKLAIDKDFSGDCHHINIQFYEWECFIINVEPKFARKDIEIPVSDKNDMVFYLDHITGEHVYDNIRSYLYQLVSEIIK